MHVYVYVYYIFRFFLGCFFRCVLGILCELVP